MWSREWEKYLKEVDVMIDSVILSLVRDSREDLKWKVPIAGLLWPKVAISDGLNRKSSYKALRSYLKSNHKGKTIEDSGGSINGTAAYATAIGKIATNSF